MSKFNLSEKVRLAEHNAYGDKVIPLEDVKEFIRLLKEAYSKKYDGCDDEVKALHREIDKLAGDKLI